MPIISGRSAFLSILKDEGITHLFGNPGTTELPIMHALSEFPEMNYVLGLQEAIVIAMADGYSRATGKLSACNVHVAPGLGNAMGAIYNAKFVGSPIIITAGQQEQGHGLMEPQLSGPLVQMAEPLVKWAIEVTRLEDLPRIMRRAAKVALAPPSGPVFISLPGDILNTEKNIDLGGVTRINDNVVPDDKTISTILKRIIKSTKPMIISGHEVACTNAFDEIQKFAEVIGAAVYQQTVTHGSHYPSEHQNFMGFLPKNQTQAKKIIEEYDLLICIGSDVLRMSVWSEDESLPKNMPILHIGLRDWEIGKNYHTELAIYGHVKSSLKKINEKFSSIDNSQFFTSAKSRIENIKNKNWSFNKKNLVLATQEYASTVPIRPEWLMMKIAENLPKKYVIVEEGLVSTRTLLKYLPIRKHNDFYGLASGGIGWAVSGAIGVSIANPDKTVIAIIGDGSSMYGIQSLWTAAHYNLDIVYIIANNYGYRIIQERLEDFHNNRNFIGMDFKSPSIDFVKLSESMGVPSTRVKDPDKIGSAIKDASKSRGPHLIDIIVDNGYD